jgi:hypothetical protein
MSSRAPFVVELVGTPGAGKTTLARELVGRLRERGLRAGTIVEVARAHAARTRTGRALAGIAPRALRRPLLWQVFYLAAAGQAVAFAVRHPSLVARVVRGQLARPISPAMKRHDLFWFLQLAGRYRFLWATSGGGEALVLDDGFVHRSVALHASHVEDVDGDRVAGYVDLVPEPDALVHVRAGRGTCERRVLERGLWRHSRHLSRAEVSRYLDNAERVVDAAVARARERGWNVIEVDNGDRAADVVGKELGEAIEPLLGTLGEVGPR